MVSYTQVNDELSPAERNLDDASKLTTPITYQLRDLRNLLDNIRQKARGALDRSEDADTEAQTGSQVRPSL